MTAVSVNAPGTLPPPTAARPPVPPGAAASRPRRPLLSQPTLAGWGAIVALLLVAGCRPHRSPAAARELPAAKVRIQKVAARKYLATEEVVGTVRSKLRATIEAKVTGRIETMLVAPGQVVKRGQLLAQLYAAEIQARLDQAVALRQQAERDLQRLGALLRDRAVTQQEYDTVEARHRVAQASVNEATTMLDYTQVTAPFDGMITRKLADVGDLAAPSRPILELEDPSALRLEADLSETLIGRVQPGLTMAVRIAALTNELVGTTSEIAPAADPGSRTFRVKLDLPPTPGLRAGQFGRVDVPLGETTIRVLPAAAVVTRGQMEMVFVANQQVAQLRLVKTGKRLGAEIELLAGLEAGEQVVVEGAQALVDGQRLQTE